MSADVMTNEAKKRSRGDEGICETCSHVADSTTPADALLTLRGLGPFYKRALAIHLDDSDPFAILSRRPSPNEWSAMDHAGHVRDVLHAILMRVQRIARQPGCVLPATPRTPPSGIDGLSPQVVAAALAANGERLASALDELPRDAWECWGRRDGRQVSILDLAREAVHEVLHHLSEIDSTLRDVRQRTRARSFN